MMPYRASAHSVPRPITVFSTDAVDLAGHDRSRSHRKRSRSGRSSRSETSSQGSWTAQRNCGHDVPIAIEDVKGVLQEPCPGSAMPQMLWPQMLCVRLGPKRPPVLAVVCHDRSGVFASARSLSSHYGLPASALKEYDHCGNIVDDFNACLTSCMLVVGKVSSKTVNALGVGTSQELRRRAAALAVALTRAAEVGPPDPSWGVQALTEQACSLLAAPCHERVELRDACLPEADAQPPTPVKLRGSVLRVLGSAVAAPVAKQEGLVLTAQMQAQVESSSVGLPSRSCPRYLTLCEHEAKATQSEDFGDVGVGSENFEVSSTEYLDDVPAMQLLAAENELSSLPANVETPGIWTACTAGSAVSQPPAGASDETAFFSEEVILPSPPEADGAGTDGGELAMEPHDVGDTAMSEAEGGDSNDKASAIEPQALGDIAMSAESCLPGAEGMIAAIVHETGGAQKEDVANTVESEDFESPATGAGNGEGCRVENLDDAPTLQQLPAAEMCSAEASTPASTEMPDMIRACTARALISRSSAVPLRQAVTRRSRRIAEKKQQVPALKQLLQAVPASKVQIQQKAKTKPSTIAEATEVIRAEGKGQCLVSTSQHQPGDLIGLEPPLFKYTPKKGDRSMLRDIKNIIQGSALEAELVHAALYVKRHEPQILPQLKVQSVPEPKSDTFSAMQRVLTHVEGDCTSERCLELCKLYLALSFNAFTLPSRQKIFVTYDVLAKMVHSCQPNCEVVVQADGRGRLEAMSPIQAGDELRISYLSEVELQQSAGQRRQRLLDKWGFNCKCPKCLCEFVNAPSSSSYFEPAYLPLVS
eukprot:TRINITY_DN6725_c0_g1_i1.p1 TRINITY_DN6725_c0_g1~~TRINITY_DN6725_c0_g1_i1.p1  ORF type:complete len:817 (-),score=123.16 TRINITY_DN6725_c0_g1_i1:8-2458(-)